ncbi:MAG: ribonuclease HII [Candidatus Portnoybacteria bacterium CG10_big_fil_rev_8_21_14_0_10_36_7]|uniref:Ribonuclease HII n=1 Tax=Candidatus Portnoybacteria bacterium CG10_big_fil_rev_8_21_14_0_10_36_7 TaxID=1974812 RepID=A0A2M8KEU2_9BACT|nr:MAG: ribonuclease HII [Candidatus Portnoybacteria bacterium CG10_big_fil_rev_8_21_14_0_10_36_7]
MQLPTIKEEQKLFNLGYEIVAGVDEVGRGCIAGPVVAGVVAIKNKKEFLESFEDLKNCRDSKTLSVLAREKISGQIKEATYLSSAVGIVSEKVIDAEGILVATKLAMKKAVENLAREPEFILLDGNFTIEDLSIAQKAIIRGDSKVFLISAASIIAKVARDELMVKYNEKYAGYDFNVHKGYGTKNHYKAILERGASPIHRLSFNLHLRK